MKDFKYLKREPSGHVYLRYKRQPLVELPREIGSPEFKAAHKRALAAAIAREKEANRTGRPAAKQRKTAPAGTVRAHVNRYLASEAFAELELSSQRGRRRILTVWCDGSKRTGLPPYGDLQLLELDADKFATLMRIMRKRAPRGFLTSVRAMLA